MRNVAGYVQESAGSKGPAPALSVLERYGGERGRQALALIAAGQMVAPAVKWALAKIRHRDSFTITVAGTDDIYPHLHEWVLARIPKSDRKALVATTSRPRAGIHSPGDPQEDARVRLLYDGSRSQEVTVEGHKVVVSVEREEFGGRETLVSEAGRRYVEKIVFLATTVGGRDAVLGMIDGLLEKVTAEAKASHLLIPARWGGEWNVRGDLPPRLLDSVILKCGQLERLIDNLGTFLASEDEYTRLSLPWHRGFLFSGAAGTGKTSVARALANHFGLSVYYLPLGDMEKDADLMSLISQVEPRSVLLLEDVDVYHAATQRGEAVGSASIATMLNGIDGIWTPHGLITIMTTNHREALDPALIRAGRVDVDEEFTNLDEEQAQRVAGWFARDRPIDARSFVGESPAAMIEALRKREGDDDDCIARGARDLVPDAA